MIGLSGVYDLPEEELRRLAKGARRMGDQREKEICEGNLLQFVMRAWSQVDPTPFIYNWHHGALCEELEALARQEFRDFICNQPPRTGKTSLIAILYPAWVWAQDPALKDDYPLMGPHVRFLCLSYSATSAERAAIKFRRLIMGEWYQKHWGERVQLNLDQAGKADMGNTAGGERLSNSIEGGILGTGGDFQIIDDPHKVQGAESDLERARTLEALSEGLPSRVTDPRLTARIMVMQRLHLEDATNYALESWPKSTLRHACLPMEYDSRRPSYIDIREEDGDLLWPEVWTPEVVQKETDELGPYAASGQLNQLPVARGGGIIQRTWWRLWPDDSPEAAGAEAFYVCPICKWYQRLADYSSPSVECPACGSAAERQVPFPPTPYRMIYVDTAYGEKQENSWSAATVWGIWHDKDDAPRAMLRHAWRGRPRLRGVPDATNPAERTGLVERIYRLATDHQVDEIVIENKTRGTDLYQELERQVREWPFQLCYDEPKGSKTVRLEACVPLFTNDRVWAPDKAWAETVISEVAAQPKAPFSDLSDTVSGALRWMRNKNLLTMGEEHRLDVYRASLYRGKSQRFDASELYEGV